ncbi:hypothetical protein [Bacillus sp. 3255]|uniref:hypothetical protein n=1 Tax=Bacillus sp. 3255 TaxID=2817904 RepID=UPI00286C9CC9|nr:hypothetical protein [Bacillus sp. 3255]
MSDKIDYVCENIERQRTKAEVRHRTRGEWEAIEREYVGTKPIPWEGYRVCGAWKCHNTYRVINGRSSMYCSVVCTNEQKAARLRLKNNGTLLPVKDYEAYRSAYVDKLRNHTEVSIRAAAGLATDNRDYRNRPKKKHNDIRTGADKVRKEPGELVCFNMRDVEHTVDWAGRYRFGNEWHSASAQFLGIIL